MSKFTYFQWFNILNRKRNICWISFHFRMYYFLCQKQNNSKIMDLMRKNQRGNLSDTRYCNLDSCTKYSIRPDHQALCQNTSSRKCHGWGPEGWPKIRLYMYFIVNLVDYCHPSNTTSSLKMKHYNASIRFKYTIVIQRWRYRASMCSAKQIYIDFHNILTISILELKPYKPHSVTGIMIKSLRTVLLFEVSLSWLDQKVILIKFWKHSNTSISLPCPFFSEVISPVWPLSAGEHPRSLTNEPSH